MRETQNRQYKCALPVSSRRTKQRGFLTVTYAVMITVIISFAGIAVDAGYMQWTKRRVQGAADAAALGALREVEQSHMDSTSLTNAGRFDASLNGFTHGQDNTSVAINYPPTTGAFTTSSTAVEAIVTRTIPSIFMAIAGQEHYTLRARAVAHITSTHGSIGGCIFALNKTMKNALNINGTTVDLFTSCSVIVESVDPDAFTMGSGAELYLGHKAIVGVVGGWTLNGQSQIIDTTINPYTTTTPVHIADPGDPFVNMAEPSPSNVPSTAVRQPNATNYSKNNRPTDDTFQPGVYCGGMTIGDTDGSTFHFAPGVYILAGGGMTVNSDANVDGTSVTFYNTNSTGWGCGGNSNFAPVTFAGQGQANLSAPTSGSLVGMLFFQDRSVTDNRVNKIVGSSASTFDGALYFKKSPLTFAGNSAANGYTVIVADQISINGTTTLRNNYSSLATPNPFAPAATGGGLVE